MTTPPPKGQAKAPNAGDAENSRPSYTTKHNEKESQKRARSAVFVAHGMGQQLRFETLAQIAEGLRAKDACIRLKESHDNPRSPTEEKPQKKESPKKSETIQIMDGDQPLPGIRVKLLDAKNKTDIEVDIYE